MAALEQRTFGRRAGGLHFALNHFDRIHSQQAFQSLMQQEMMRLHRGEENALTPIVEKVFRPHDDAAARSVCEGKRTGELIEADEWQIMYAALGANVFYFLSAPVMGMMTGDPLERERDGVSAQSGCRVSGAGNFYRSQTWGGGGGAGAGTPMRNAPMPEKCEANSS